MDEAGRILLWVLGIVGGVIVPIVCIFMCVFTVEQQTVAVIERFGRFLRIAREGLGFKIPIVDSIVGRPSLRIVEIPVAVDTITKDKVSVRIEATVQCCIKTTSEDIWNAFYKLSHPQEQIKSWVYDAVRAKVPEMPLDDVFERKDDIAHHVGEHLGPVLDEYGYLIVKALVTNVHPNSQVVAAMNEINAAKREREAALERGEAARIVQVKQAEAESESKKLQGQGIAAQRTAIIDGLRASVEDRSRVDGGRGDGVGSSHSVL